MSDNDRLNQPPHGPSKRPTPEQGRQGQNVRGMTTVLVVSVALVIVGFIVVFVLSNPGPSTTDAPAGDEPVSTRDAPN